MKCGCSGNGLYFLHVNYPWTKTITTCSWQHHPRWRGNLSFCQLPLPTVSWVKYMYLPPATWTRVHFTGSHLSTSTFYRKPLKHEYILLEATWTQVHFTGSHLRRVHSPASHFNTSTFCWNLLFNNDYFWVVCACCSLVQVNYFFHSITNTWFLFS